VPNWEKENYQTERIFVTARDGITRIPVSLVYRKYVTNGKGERVQRKFPMPMLIEAYGHYGNTVDPTFELSRPVLLDHGICYAIAHIRGGGEFGKKWHSKLKTKMDTYTDFIDVASHMIHTGRTSRKQLAITGGSAGGLLMSVVVNMAPTLFRVVVLNVPAVDKLVTTRDPDGKITTYSWTEWGNPNQKEFYDNIIKYSPMDNIKPSHYPAILALANWDDSRVGYWEAAKWVPRIRESFHKWIDIHRDTLPEQVIETIIQHSPILLKIEKGGHFSSSNKKVMYKNNSTKYAFIMHYLGIDIVKSCLYPELVYEHHVKILQAKQAEFEKKQKQEQTRTRNSLLHAMKNAPVYSDEDEKW